MKGLPGTFMRARLRDVLAPLVQFLGDDLVRFKGPVASRVAFLELRSKAAVERAVAQHKSRPFEVRFEEGADIVAIVLDVDRPPAIRRMASMQYASKRLLLAEADVCDVIFVRKGRPSDKQMEVLVRRTGREALEVVAAGTFAEGSRANTWTSLELTDAVAHLRTQAGAFLGEARDE